MVKHIIEINQKLIIKNKKKDFSGLMLGILFGSKKNIIYIISTPPPRMAFWFGLPTPLKFSV